MKTRKWLVKLISLTLLFTLLLGSSALAGWQKDGNKWWYSYENGGYAKNTWIQDGNGWYYFGGDGYMVTGWRNLGSWYHFNSSGKMDTGWLNDKGAWYYLDRTGAMVTGWQKLGSWYHFSGSGKMDTGWLNDGGTWYYLDQSGAMVTGWRQIDGAWYHFDASGRMITNTYIDQKYYVDSNGQWDGSTGSAVSETNTAAAAVAAAEPASNKSITFTFHQNGWYVARLEVQIFDEAKQEFKWIYSDSCARGQKTTVTLNNSDDINRVGYQIWFFGWNNDYMNIPWANTDYATDFTLSGYGDYPEFTWK
jgi:hypothetical protein